jgi:hypothetical protein
MEDEKSGYSTKEVRIVNRNCVDEVKKVMNHKDRVIIIVEVDRLFLKGIRMTG